jgi:hypothetical protein
MRAVNVLLSVIVVAIVVAGAGTYLQIKTLSTAVSQLRQDEAARAAAFGSAIAQLQKDSVAYFSALGFSLSEIRNESVAYFTGGNRGQTTFFFAKLSATPSMSGAVSRPPGRGRRQRLLSLPSVSDSSGFYWRCRS